MFAVLFGLKYLLLLLGLPVVVQVLILLVAATGFAWLFWWNCTPDRRGVAVLVVTLWIAGLVKILNAAS